MNVHRVFPILRQKASLPFWTVRSSATRAAIRAVSSTLVTSILGAAEVIEAQTGRTLDYRPLGLEAGLRVALAEAAQDTSNPFKAVMVAY